MRHITRGAPPLLARIQHCIQNRQVSAWRWHHFCVSGGASSGTAIARYSQHYAAATAVGAVRRRHLRRLLLLAVALKERSDG